MKCETSNFETYNKPYWCFCKSAIFKSYGFPYMNINCTIEISRLLIEKVLLPILKITPLII